VDISLERRGYVGRTDGESIRRLTTRRMRAGARRGRFPLFTIERCRDVSAELNSRDLKRKLRGPAARKPSPKYRSPVRLGERLASPSRTPPKPSRRGDAIYPTMTGGRRGGGGEGIDAAGRRSRIESARSRRRSPDRDAPSARSLFRSFIPFAITTSAAR